MIRHSILFKREDKMGLFLNLIIFALTMQTIEASTCEDKAPEWCEKHKEFCHKKWIKIFKMFCQKSCGYCTPPPTKPPTTWGPTSPPYTGKCGQPEVRGVRVIAGTTPPRGAWPWQILLSFKGRSTCGGTLLSPEWVVTAAHCVMGREEVPSNFVVRVGEHDRNIAEGSEVDVEVAKIIRHPKYTHVLMSYDIALLKLSSPVKLNKYVQPACFPSADPPVGTKCYVTGWGKTHHPGEMTQVLQQGLLPIVSNKVCFKKNRRFIPIPISSDMICAGSGSQDRISGCHGDSGGPFVCHLNGKWELHGDVSHGSPRCDSRETYNVFCRTNYLKDWIREKMARGE